METDILGYLLLLGAVVFGGCMAVALGALVGRVAGSRWIGGLASIAIYSALVFAGCWLLYATIPPPPPGMSPQLHALNRKVLGDAAAGVVVFGATMLLIGGIPCFLLPVALLSGSRRRAVGERSDR